MAKKFEAIGPDVSSRNVKAQMPNSRSWLSRNRICIAKNQSQNNRFTMKMRIRWTAPNFSFTPKTLKVAKLEKTFFCTTCSLLTPLWSPSLISFAKRGKLGCWCVVVVILLLCCGWNHVVIVVVVVVQCYLLLCCYCCELCYCCCVVVVILLLCCGWNNVVVAVVVVLQCYCRCFGDWRHY